MKLTHFFLLHHGNTNLHIKNWAFSRIINNVQDICNRCTSHELKDKRSEERKIISLARPIQFEEKKHFFVHSFFLLLFFCKYFWDLA